MPGKSISLSQERASLTGGHLLSRTQPQSISDDDLCADCAHCSYRPGELSRCEFGFPGEFDEDDYVAQCPQFKQRATPAPDSSPNG